MNTLPVVLFCFVFVVATNQDLTDKQKETIEKYREECIAETNVDPVLIEQADKGRFSDAERLKCYFKCFYLKVGFVDELGELRKNEIKSRIPERADRAKVLEVIETCERTKANEHVCGKVYEVHKCYFKNAPEY